ncbi:EamA family transporter [Candidatus Saccharibacteria bacterium]|nr:EamA family transporter [Candidatus Saccharibacteria bacterium]
MTYLLAFIIASCLVAGQSLWASTVKYLTSSNADISGISLIQKMILQPRFWLGVMAYLIGTACYFLLLSKVKFYSVQLTMTGLAIILSVLVAHFLFKESISWQNLVGIALILSGILLVFNR